MKSLINWQALQNQFSTTILIAVFQLAAVNSSIGQCPMGDITINTQDSLNNFIAQHGNCDSITGNFTLGGSSLTDISGLTSLTHISGTLRVTISGLSSLAGLENISSIGNSLLIENNNLITDLTGISGHLIQGLDGDITIRSNNLLQSITHLGGIVSASDILILGNPQLQSLQGLESIDTVFRTLKIDNNDNLLNLIGIDSLEYVGINLIVEDHALLTDCSVGCQYINSNIVQNQVIFQRNPSPCETTTEVKIYCQPTLCPQDDFLLTTQGEVEAFVNTYATCDTILGSLEIDGNIANLDGLSFIKVITGDLTVRDNNIVDSIQFLKNIISIGGNVRIQNMDALVGLYGFPGSALPIVHGNLTIRDHAVLANVDDLDGLSEVHGELLIRSNPALTSVNGLNKLTYVEDDLFLSTNSALPSLQGLQNVNKVDRALTIANHPLLVDCNAICLLVSSGGVAGLISLNNNPFPCNSATNFAANCTPPPCVIGDVIIEGQADLDTFAMDNLGCDTLFGSIIIQGDVSDLGPLSFIRLISGSVTIRNTSTLTSLSGLSDLKIQGAFTVLNNDITSLDGFEELELLDDVSIVNNNSLTTLSAMSSLTTANNLTISENNIIADLTGLENLVSVDGSLFIINLDNLSNINALSNVSGVGAHLNITSNGNLSDCTGICQLLDGSAVQGQISIASNLADCFSLKEVQLACTAHLCDGRDLIFASPVDETITIQATHSITGSSSVAGDVTWKAGFGIELKSGFSVEQMSVFQISIIDQCEQ